MPEVVMVGAFILEGGMGKCYCLNVHLNALKFKWQFYTFRDQEAYGAMWMWWNFLILAHQSLHLRNSYTLRLLMTCVGVIRVLVLVLRYARNLFHLTTPHWKDSKFFPLIEPRDHVSLSQIDCPCFSRQNRMFLYAIQFLSPNVSDAHFVLCI